METQDFTRCKALNNIPYKKLQDELQAIQSSNQPIENKNILSIAFNRYAEANIPLEYWNLNIPKDFHGSEVLLNKYNEYVSDLKQSYFMGDSLCFAGNHGVGKTLISTSILKKACLKGYSCLYSDLSNIVSVLIQANNDDKFTARKELCTVDFLIIDEVDPRFFNSSEASTELYAKSFESIFRIRKQNKLPTIICTNSPNIIASFGNNSLRDSLSSILHGVKIVNVWGEDHRKKS